VQSAALALHGSPIRWRIDSRHAPAAVRAAGRVATQLGLIAALLTYPGLIGRPIVDYYRSFFPTGPAALQLARGAAAAVLMLCALYGAWIASGRIEVFTHQQRRKWQRRLVLLIPTAALGALVEELIFRGVLLNDLLRAPWLPRSAGLLVAAIFFAAAHYVRAVKRRWTFPGHLLLGLLLCIAFVQTGALWLPIGLHAGGILMIMGTRPFFWYEGPSWLTGASIFPFAGVAGWAGLGVLTAFVVYQ
jgi:membrane protease YdiL (CAAX protease family)